MKRYNDYISMTRRYLKSYNEFKIAIENMTADIESHRLALSAADDVGSAIAKYGDTPLGGTPELNSVEGAAERRIRREKAIADLTANRAEVQRMVDKIDRAVGALGDVDRMLVQCFYIDGKSWLAIGHEHHYSEKWARERGGKALRSVAFMLFGPRTVPEQLSFVFAG